VGKFTAIKTSFEGPLLITPTAFEDARGFFMESYNEAEFKEIGIVDHFVQDNHSHSTKGVLRGMHFQSAPHPVAKLVRCVSGEVFDVIVDMRPESPTFKKWEGFTLSAENKKTLYVPVGFGHGFYTLSTVADFVYKVTDYYFKECDSGFQWNDPGVGIVWPNLNPLISPRDSQLPLFKEVKI
jgi:dTDP-4-dehydrorhamnose 3,5-epimerase